ncbi:MAG TPA: hypothetical protein VGP93_18090, partial [Polyangiaceae bacterium]|nr:hypothetical protein [Polyangiaceae bacterium]
MKRKGDKKRKAKQREQASLPAAKGKEKRRAAAKAATREALPRASRQEGPRPTKRKRRERKSARGERKDSSAPSQSGLELEMTDADVISEEVPELGLGSRMVPPTVVFHESHDSTPPSSNRSAGDVAEQIRALEARLDGMMRGGTDNGAAAPEKSEEEASAPPDLGAPPAANISESPYFEQQWGRMGLRN